MKIPEPNISIANLIDKKVEEGQEAPRAHLGASLLGHPCDRYLWLMFRWAVIEKFDGRILRLFQRGQREEAVIINLLRSIGIEVEERAEQMRVDFGAHVSGSLDGIISGGVPEAPAKKHIAEFKTHSLKSFNDLTAKGVRESKPQHWAQMQCYMKGSGIDRALYVAVCKDNDHLYTERVRYDEAAAISLINRGTRITTSDRMPEPLSADPSWYQCKFCPCYDFCFNTHLTKEINCRTCALSTACVNSTWTCMRYGEAEIPVDAQRTGCEGHVLHPDLVPWQVLNSDEDFTAVYQVDGKLIKNGAPDSQVYSSQELLSGEWKTEDITFKFGR
ncbi:MAG: hypothetical protein EOM03_14370 [Clostridia bacterium]|nr:hypothetical protein [Clostridia bacterium]